MKKNVKAFVEQERQKKIQRFWADATVKNYKQKLQQWERIKKTI